MSGEKLIEIACNRLREKNMLTTDENIVREIRSFKPQDFVEEIKDRRVKI